MYFSKKQQKPPPKWFKWGMLLLIAIAVFNAAFKDPIEPRQQPIERGGYTPREIPSLKEVPALQKTFDGNRWEKLLNPDKIHQATWEVLEEGVGETASCGQNAQVQILAEGEDSTATTEQYVIGDSSRAVGMMQVITGMRAGEKRLAKIPKHILTNPVGEATLETESFTISLEDLQPAPHNDAIGFSRSAQLPTAIEQLRKAALCGQTVSVQLEIADAAGQFQPAVPFTFTLGDPAIPHGLTRAMMRVPPDGKVTATIPPAYANTSTRTEKWMNRFDGSHIVIVRMTRTQ